MAMRDITLVGNLYQVGPVWYYDRSVAGTRYRVSTGCTDRLAAARWARDRDASGILVRSLMELGDRQILDMLRRARERAALKRVTYDMNVDDVLAMWRRAGGYCEVTKVPFSMRQHGGSGKRPFAPSIDRISPKLGYVPDNCRLVCISANLAMNEFGEDVLWKLAMSMVFHRNKRRR